MRQRQLALNTFVVLLSVLGLIAAPAAVAPRLSASALAQDKPAQDQTLTEEDVIAGSMDIQFNTRTNLDSSGDLLENSAAVGAMDNYKFGLSVAKTTEFEGQITR